MDSSKILVDGSHWQIKYWDYGPNMEPDIEIVIRSSGHYGSNEYFSIEAKRLLELISAEYNKQPQEVPEEE